jgi:hypothetical protein
MKRCWQLTVTTKECAHTTILSTDNSSLTSATKISLGGCKTENGKGNEASLIGFLSFTLLKSNVSQGHTLTPRLLSPEAITTQIPSETIG